MYSASSATSERIVTRSFDTFRADVVRRLYEVTRRVSSSADLAEVLHEIAQGVVEGLGYGVAAISRLEGDTLVMAAVAGEDVDLAELIGRRTPAEQVLGREFSIADHWGILRFVPHDRLPLDQIESLWVPDLEVSNEPDAWHPLDALYAPLYSSTGELLGSDDAVIAEAAFTTIPQPLSAFLDEKHAIKVHLSRDQIQVYLACGDIGGTVDADGALIVGMKELDDSGYAGIAYLVPAANGGTNISVLIAQVISHEDEAADQAATPAAPAPSAHAADGVSRWRRREGASPRRGDAPSGARVSLETSAPPSFAGREADETSSQRMRQDPFGRGIARR